MSLSLRLPDTLPDGAFDATVILRTLPEQSFRVHVALNPGGDTAAEPVSFYIYGRGVGGQATEKPHLVAHFDAATVRRRARPRDNTLVLTAEDLSGQPLDTSLLDVEAVSVV